MGKLTKPLAASLRLVAAFPLHLAAAFLAAVIADALLTVQPLFLRAFIDQSRAGLPKAKLWLFPAFMLGAALLSYAFDFISVAIRFLLQRRLSRRLKEAYIEFGDRTRPGAAQFALRTGIGNLSQLSLSLTIDFVLALSRVGLILIFLSLDGPLMGLATLAVLILGVGAAAGTTSRIGRLGRALELAQAGMVSRAVSGKPARTKFDRFYSFDQAQFVLKSANVFMSFCIFRLLPVGALAWYLLASSLSLGSLASTFLYFSMLRGPYGDLVALLQDSIVSFSETSFFGDDLQRGLELQRLFASAPRGLIWERGEARRGEPLSRAAQSASREFYDDLGESPKDGPLHELAKRSRAASLLIHSADPNLRRFAHFFRREGGGLSTILGAA